MHNFYKLFNMNCIEYMKELSSNSVDVTLTDIPYNEVSRVSGGLRNLDKKDADLETFDLTEFVNEVIRITKKSIYIFCGSLQLSTILQLMKSQELSTRSCVWEKNNPSIMNGDKLWLSSLEHCAFGKKPNATFNGSCLSTVWRYPVFRYEQHPTPKPIKLFKHLINISSNKGDLIFDPCMGSGTCAIACLETGRRFIGIELNAFFFNNAQQRIESTAPSLTFFEEN